jgi:cyclic pyranopterin phosphate synthase
VLTFEEIAHFVHVAASLGVDKIRLTGGEPLMRRGLSRLVAMVAVIPGIRDVGLTTNGLLLADQAQALYDAGLRRINISLDTLDPARFRELTRRDGLERVIEGIHAAKRAGFDPIKINAVSIRGLTEVEVGPLGRFAREYGLDLRFIEYMPNGADHWERTKVYFAHEILEQLEREIAPLVPVDNYDPRAPAMEFRYTDGGGRVGIIASVSRPFCRSCNRVRLTSDGKLRNCLFALGEVDVKGLLRDRTDDAELAQVIRRNVLDKWEGHEINTAKFVRPERTMHTIGG